MKQRTVVIGIIVVIVGGVMLVGGAIGALGSITIHTSFTQLHPGEYVSAEIMLNRTSNLLVSSPAASGGIVSAQDLSLVNFANLNTYAIPYNASAVGNNVYRSLIGDYYYVAFSSSQPNTKIVATPQGSLVLAYGLLAVLGVVVAVGGIVVVIVGVLQKERPQVPGQSTP